MRKLFALLNISIFLLAIYLPFLSPIAGEATSPATRFGTELNSPINGSDAIYADLMMLAWPTGPQPRNSQGYPTTVGTNAQLFLTFQGYPNGNYQFYCEGKFRDLYFAGYPMKSVQTSVVNGKTITTAIVPMTFPALKPITFANSGGGQLNTLLIDYTPTDATDLPTNFHLMRPDVPAWYDGWTAKNSIFGKEFIKAISPFCAIRFVNWMFEEPSLVTGPFGTETGQANNYGVTDWASRPSSTSLGGARTIVYENMIELCNETNKDMWINIPYYAAGGMDGTSPTDWCANMATLIKQKLKPNLHVYYEIWDELWNSGPTYWYGWKQVEVWGAANPALGPVGGGGVTRHGAEMAVLLMNAEQIMQPILGAQGRPILAHQFSWTIYGSGGLAYIAKNFGPPSKYIYAVAGAPYFVTNSALPASTPVGQSMLSFIDTMQPQFDQNVALAKQYGVKFCCYEAGQSLNGSTATLFAQGEAAQSDPAMATCYYKLASMIEAAGTDTAMWYSFCMQDGVYGFWGALDDIRQINNNPPSVKYAAQVNINNATCKCGNTARAPLTAAQKRALAKEQAAAAKAKQRAAEAAAKAAAEKAKEEAAAKKKR